MANDKITMLKLKRMLQLLDAGKSMNEICRDLHMSKRTVHNYKQRVTSSSVPLAELRRLDDKQLNQLLQPQSPVPKPDERKEALDKELSNYLKEWNKPYVSILLLWEEYRKAYPNGYQYTQFKKYLNEYKKSQEYSYHNVYIPGEEMQIDYAGDKLYIRDKSSGIWVEVVVLCCVMPYSSKAFAMGAFDSTQENLFHCLSRCMSYFGRVPKIAKSDNMVQWVKHGSQYERPFTESTDEWANHYDIIPDITRVRKPKDKAPVESLVDQVYKYVYARLRNTVFYTLDELNRAIFALMDEYNSRPMQVKGVSRDVLYFQDEYPVMHELPDKPYTFRYRKEVTLAADYHVLVGKEQHKYSAPYQYVSKPVTVLWDMDTVEIYNGLERIAIHKRSFVKYGYTTEESHMPPNHLAYKRSKELNADDYLKRAMMIGPEAKWAVGRLIESTILPQYAYRNCQSFFRFAEKHGAGRVEQACTLIHAQTDVFSFQLLKNMVEKNLDKAAISGINDIISTTPYNEEVRGAASFSQTNS